MGLAVPARTARRSDRQTRPAYYFAGGVPAVAPLFAARRARKTIELFAVLRGQQLCDLGDPAGDGAAISLTRSLSWGRHPFNTNVESFIGVVPGSFTHERV